MEKKDLKIVFLGTPDFAVESLKRLHEGGYNIAGVITMPDKPAGRGHKLLHSPVKQYAEANGLKLMQPTNLKSQEFIEELRSIGANLFIVIAFRMLPEVVWSMPELGTFNLHASLLPKYRGAAPINWAVINGETETGVTTFFLKHDIDTGDILRQERIEIKPDDNAGTVHDRLMMLGADLTMDTVEHILAGDLKSIPQSALANDSEMTPAPKIFKETCHIDWNKPTIEIHDLVRGLSPYPAAWIEMTNGTDSHQVKIFTTSIAESKRDGLRPGTITAEDGHLYITTGDGRIEVLELQLAGKRRMTAAEFLRGFDISGYNAN
ncbi:MAG: methionyl-tRNA formyltransferase [Pseudoflavonifractor sp.]|nr:methionyl-tRNA formyltransferase [Pseudoflavonifractor sp.]